MEAKEKLKTVNFIQIKENSIKAEDLTEEYYDFLNTLSNLKDQNYKLYFSELKNLNYFIKQKYKVNDIKNYQINFIKDYEEEIRKYIEAKKITRGTGVSRIRKVQSFMKYLFNQKRINFIYQHSIQTNKAIENGKNLQTIFIPEKIKEFLTDLEIRNYSNVYYYQKRILYYYKFLLNKNFISNFNADFISLENIKKFHSYLDNKVNLEIMERSSALLYLRAIKLYIEYINRSSNYKIQYSIPERFRVQGNRSNEYVPQQEIFNILKTILNHSRNPIRDISISLLVIDTGCRPIEIINLDIKSVFITESCLLLKSKKSGQRKLRISPLVKEYLCEYLEIRLKHLSGHNSLFLNENNKPMYTHSVYAIFYKANLKLYNKSKYSPKSLRHSYITNALDNNNSFEQVSKAVGHKHLVSTLIYLEKSTKRLLSNSLPHNPYEYLFKEE